MNVETSPRFDPEGDWFHGSPRKLEILSVSSTITQDRDLARVFSHKPSLVSQEHDGTERQIKHSGAEPGFLYLVAEPVTELDIWPHPTSTMAPGQEWLIRRELRVELIGPTEIEPQEVLKPHEIEELRDRAALQAQQVENEGR